MYTKDEATTSERVGSISILPDYSRLVRTCIRYEAAACFAWAVELFAGNATNDNAEVMKRQIFRQPFCTIHVRMQRTRSSPSELERLVYAK